MSRRKRSQPKSDLDIIRSIRGDWGAINPVTKIIPNKKKNPKQKHRNKIFNEE